MPAREKQYVSLDASNPVNDLVGSCTYFPWRFPAGTAITEQLPIRSAGMDFRTAETFILAVVPFQQVRVYLRGGAKPCQFTSPSRALQGTAKHFVERQTFQTFPELRCISFAALGQRKIGPSSMLARYGPGGFTVAGQIDDRKFLTHASPPSVRMLARIMHRFDLTPRKMPRSGDLVLFFHVCGRIASFPATSQRATPFFGHKFELSGSLHAGLVQAIRPWGGLRSAFFLLA